MSQEVSARVQDLLDQASTYDLGKEKHSLLVEAFQLAQEELDLSTLADLYVQTSSISPEARFLI